MAGTFVRDADAPDLLTGVTLDAAGTDTGTVWDAQFPCEFGVNLVTVLAGGTDPTIAVEIQASSVSDFASDVVTIAKFATITDDAAADKLLFCYTPKRYVRSSVVITETSGADYTGATATVVPKHDRRTVSSSA